MIFNVHCPNNQAFALTYKHADTLPVLLARIADKAGLPSGEKIGGKTGWKLKYDYQSKLWSIDDEDDFNILLSRFNTPASEPHLHLQPPSLPLASHLPHLPHLPNLLHRKKSPPSDTDSVRNGHHLSGGNGALALVAKAGKGGRKTNGTLVPVQNVGLKHQKEFEAFHGGIGVRTIEGSIGPVQNVRMLLKSGYRHVYVSRGFAQTHGFIPKDAAPGWYGYGGLVNLGQWPIKVGTKQANHTVMLSEESHFDVILGRSWMEKQGVQTDPLDQTSVVLMAGPGGPEKIACDIVVIKNGMGEVVTVT